MFDIGFSELLILGLVALLVLGPERLPRVARTVGYWAGRARGYMRQMTTELEREVQQAEIREQIEKTRRTLNESLQSAQKATTATPDTSQANAAPANPDTPPRE